MVVENEEVEQFKCLCENSIFAHREEILKRLEKGDLTLESYKNSGVPSRELLDIYEGRAKHLSKYQSSHAKRLREEVLSFCKELKKVPNDLITLWIVSKDKTTDFSIFSNSEKILGCLLTVDKRMVSEDDWKNLWNKN